MEKMENKSSVFVSKFKCEGKTLYVAVEWKESDCDLCHIKIFDGENNWKGRYSNEFAERYMLIVQESPEDYKNNVRDALSKENDKYVYDMKLLPQRTDAAAFSWIKQYEDSAKVVHGCIPVHLKETNCKNELIDILIEENKQLREVVDRYNKNILTVNSELEQSKYELEKFMNLKTSLEMSVYGKFLTLLNNKKKRIQLLEESINEQEKNKNLLNELD